MSVTVIRQSEPCRQYNLQKNTKVAQVGIQSNLAATPHLSLAHVRVMKSNVLAFQGNSENKSPETVAHNSLAVIDNLLERNHKLNETKDDHIQMLSDLRNVLGGKTQMVTNPDKVSEKVLVRNGLTITNLNEGNNLKVLRNTLATMASASENNPKPKYMGDKNTKGYIIQVNNLKLNNLIKPSYNEESFNKLFKTLDKNGVFGIQCHPVLGTPKTSGVTAGEDFEMGARYWITDSCHNIELMKAKEPESVPKALKTIARFYKENEPAINSFINEPIQGNNNPNHPINMIRAGKLEEAKLLGVPHIFIPKEDANSRDGIELALDEDFNRWRQESHGNALKSLVSGIREGVIDGKETGLKDEDLNKDVIDTVGNLVSYFKAIDYPNAPSSGNWEEKPFAQGLTYDTAVITSALKDTKQLMEDLNNPEKPELMAVRNSLISSKNGAILGDTKEMDKLIKSGEERVKRTYDAEAPASGDYSARKYDASQLFTVRLAKFDDDPIKDAKKKFEVLEGVEKNLAGDFGIARYKDDSYLGADYDTAVDKDGKISLGYFDIKSKFGSKDCSTEELMKARSEICGGHDAQWFFDPVMSSAYGKIKKDLLKAGISKNHPMVKEAAAGQVKFLNRGIARISGAKADETEYLKSNGHPSHEWAVPEAYQAVTALNGEKKYIVGRNSPLTWAEKELHQACKEYQKTL